MAELGGSAESETFECNPSPHPLHRRVEPRRVDGFQQVVNRVDLEGFDGARVERRDEHDLRSCLEIDHAACDVEAGEAGHLHIEKDEIGLEAIDGVDGF